MDLKQLCNDVIDLAKKVGSFINNEQGDLLAKNIESKGKHNFVTYIDKEAEKQLVYQLKKLIVKSGFIVEEGTSTIKGKVYNWIVDPLDGTTNFIHNAPPYAISIALMEGAEIVLGVVYEITRNECFYSYRGSNVFLNDTQIQVSTINKVSDSLIATGFPYSNFGRLNSFMKTLEYFFNNSHGVRRLGSAAADLAYVASGRYDAFYEYNLNVWDVAAGAFLVEQAGGRVSDFSGGTKYLFGKEIVASNSAVFDEFQQVIGRFMNNLR
jgi:myo-inositol-1(or 4)-monophosphatase